MLRRNQVSLVGNILLLTFILFLWGCIQSTNTTYANTLNSYNNAPIEKLFIQRIHDVSDKHLSFSTLVDTHQQGDTITEMGFIPNSDIWVYSKETGQSKRISDQLLKLNISPQDSIFSPTNPDKLIVIGNGTNEDLTAVIKIFEVDFQGNALEVASISDTRIMYYSGGSLTHEKENNALIFSGVNDFSGYDIRYILNLDTYEVTNSEQTELGLQASLNQQHLGLKHNPIISVKELSTYQFSELQKLVGTYLPVINEK